MHSTHPITINRLWKAGAALVNTISSYSNTLCKNNKTESLTTSTKTSSWTVGRQSTPRETPQKNFYWFLKMALKQCTELAGNFKTEFIQRHNKAATYLPWTMCKLSMTSKCKINTTNQLQWQKTKQWLYSGTCQSKLSKRASGAVVAQLACVRLLEREVQGSILGDLNVCFDFPLIRACTKASYTRKTEHWQREGIKGAPSAFIDTSFVTEGTTLLFYFR